MLNYTVELITSTGFIVLLYGIYILVIQSIPNRVDVTDDHLQENLEHNARICVLSTMESSKTTMASYDDTASSLILLDPAYRI